MAKKSGDKSRVACVNRKARHDYMIEATIEAGLALRGAEVKALRQGNGNLTDAYAMIREGRVTLHGFEISRYTHDQTGREEPRRSRALLLNAAEILQAGHEAARERDDPGALVGVLQGAVGQGRAGIGSRQAQAGQARGAQAPPGRTRNGPGSQAQALTPGVLRGCARAAGAIVVGGRGRPGFDRVAVSFRWRAELPGSS